MLIVFVVAQFYWVGVARGFAKGMEAAACPFVG
jgi:hypothetical protein